MKAVESDFLNTVPVPERQRVAASFSRCASSYDSHAGVQQRVAEDLLSKITLSPRESLLDIGCGTGRHTYALARSGATVHGLDIAPGMIAYAAQRYPDLTFHQGQAEALPFASQSFDQLFSSMALQWCQSPQTVMHEMQRVLKKGGRASLAIMVDGSFEELDRARRVAGMAVTTNPQASYSQWCDAAATAGFTLTEAKLVAYVDAHPDLLSLLRSIKHTGAGVTTAEGARLSRQDLKKLSMTYQSLHGENNSLPLTYNIAQLIVEK
ncbi:methyltransferase domain-containing protein [Alteromonas antoniana]|uniref:methyltransferase domain-containing protein n=1 Tax=Alteromonas antoniana TaxID=2803813 RepID=UPI001C4487AD